MLDMLFRLAYAQGILFVMNSSSVESSPSPFVAIALALTPSLALARESLAPVRKVDQLMDVEATFTLEEPTSPPPSTKRAYN